jgi:hypothetical protein
LIIDIARLKQLRHSTTFLSRAEKAADLIRSHHELFRALSFSITAKSNEISA